MQLRITRSAEMRIRLLRTARSELLRHMKIEEEIFYPTCQLHPRLSPLTEHCCDEHDEIRQLLQKVSRLDASQRNYAHQVTELIRAVERHFIEEEDRIFPKVRESLVPRDYEKLNRELIQAHPVRERGRARKVQRRRPSVAAGRKATASEKPAPRARKRA